jgi:hypothetical protein
VELSDILLKGHHPKTISAKFSGLQGEDGKVYDIGQKDK